MQYKIDKITIFQNDPADFKMPYLVYGSADLQNTYDAYRRLGKVRPPGRIRLGNFRGNMFAP